MKPGKKNTQQWPFATNRNRWLRWAILGTAFGVFMLIRFATVGKWLGAFLVVYGIASGLRAFFEHKAGSKRKLQVTKHDVSVPVGRYKPGSTDIPMSNISSIFFLRKSAPFGLSKPVLVIDTGAQTVLLPRDWFQDPEHQEQLAKALWQQQPE